ncbi:MAG: dockerin type I repeat-containing protein [Oscillospiraceae bacterium]|nr:dockerin type I repeat-containing protein [Oscillospiraceae bacterium]
MKKIKLILEAIVSTAMLFITMGNFWVFACPVGELDAEEREYLLTHLSSEQKATVEEYWAKTGTYDLPAMKLYPEKPTTSKGETEFWNMINSYAVSELLLEHDFYTIPYSFEEFLALNDEEFLALEDVPNSVKKCYKEIRHYENADVAYVYFEFNDTVDFGMHGNLVAERREELCELLNIPQEMICNLRYHEKCSVIKGYSIEINEAGYNGYSKKYVQNKLEAYLHFQKTICHTETEVLLGKLDPTPGDLDHNGEVGVTDVVILQKWLLGSGELENWQSADLHEDGIINIYDLLLLKCMLIEQ